MIRRIALLLALALPGATLAQDRAPGVMAEEAAQALSEARAKLDAAGDARDRIRALTETVHAYEDGLGALREGLRRARAEEVTLRRRIDAESQTLQSLLGVLLTMQQSPETTLLLHPSGPLDTARAGMLLTDVSPELAKQTAAMRARVVALEELETLQTEASATLQQGLEDIAEARTQLGEAVNARQEPPRRLTSDDAALKALAESAETLDGFAANLKSLNRAPGGDFRALKGKLPLPVSGHLLRRAGATDAAGVTRPGVILATPARGVVTAPMTATIRYLGPLLDYGNVIVLEPATGWMMVMAGLETLYGAPGDIVDAGDPIGLMGGQVAPVPSMVSADATPRPPARPVTLYLELRRKGEPIDPAPWFTALKEQ